MTTYGMEIEVVNMPVDLTNTLMEETGLELRQGDDGSIRQVSYSVDEIPITPIRTPAKLFAPEGARRNSPIGLEVITPPLEEDAMYTFCEKSQKILRRIRPGDNASIHVHMDVGNKDWRFIQNLVHWFINLEAPLFRLSGLGTPHRGLANDYKFCRPISTPIFARSDDSALPSPLINVPQLMAANSATAFFAAWGRMDLLWGDTRHYSPHRLHGINIYCTPTLGTVELRIFNGVYGRLITCMDIASSLYKLAEREDARLYQKPMLLGDPPNIEFEDLKTLLFTSVRDIDTLQKLWHNSNWLPRAARGLFHHYSDNSDNRISWGATQSRLFTINKPENRDNGGNFVPYYRLERR